MITGSKNRGDWGEFYVLVYLLGERKLHAADQNLHAIPSMFFPIKKIFRTESSKHKVKFNLTELDSVEIYVNDKKVDTMKSSDLKKEAEFLLETIPHGSKSFSFKQGEELLNRLQCNRLAAPSKDITDIRMEVHDVRTSMDQIMGFSIKSYFGNAPTLLNASKATNFIFEITGITKELADDINRIETENKIQDRISAVLKANGKFSFKTVANTTFAGNLIMIDSRMGEILAEALKLSYISNCLDCKEIIERLENLNPLRYPRKGIYTHKFKEFLCAKALGMNPARPWNGLDDANGGYIVAKTDGEVLAFHLYNRDKFKEYLFTNTKFERSSTSKHNYAYLYSENNKMYLNLNLQIRFKPMVSNYQFGSSYYGEVADKPE